MNALTQPITPEEPLVQAAADVRQAQEALQRTLAAVRSQPAQAGDPLVIGKFGDLHIRIEVASALLERAERIAVGPQDAAEQQVAAAEARLASAEAWQQADNLEQQLTGRRSAAPLNLDPLKPVHAYNTLIGQFRLNGILPSSARSPVDVP